MRRSQSYLYPGTVRKNLSGNWARTIMNDMDKAERENSKCIGGHLCDASYMCQHLRFGSQTMSIQLSHACTSSGSLGKQSSQRCFESAITTSASI